ncbi:MAG: hypothetical protein QOI98_2627 [Solirubrobacteraceae bacterium]|nr:hypothetical protein [Solirubrobacteraceae bacterium]
MVEPDRPRSYHGHPVIKEPVWKPEVPFYFFAGGMAGASAPLALLAEASGHDELARRAWAVALGGVAVSPALLISDLGVPKRFLNMLRVFKVTSPMSVGSWLLSAIAPAIGVATLHAWTGRPRAFGPAAKLGAAVLGPPLSTYTAALIANTAVPAWHEARGTLPFVFAAGSAASAGAVAAAVTPPRHAAPARRLAIGGAAAEIVAAQVMERRLGELGRPYREGSAGRFKRIALALMAAGAALLAYPGRRRAPAVAGGGLVAAGALCERWSVFRAGFQSAAQPEWTVGPQRERVKAGAGHGAAR